LKAILCAAAICLLLTATAFGQSMLVNRWHEAASAEYSYLHDPDVDLGSHLLTLRHTIEGTFDLDISVNLDEHDRRIIVEPKHFIYRSSDETPALALSIDGYVEALSQDPSGLYWWLGGMSLHSSPLRSDWLALVPSGTLQTGLCKAPLANGDDLTKLSGRAAAEIKIVVRPARRLALMLTPKADIRAADHDAIGMVGIGLGFCWDFGEHLWDGRKIRTARHDPEDDEED